MDKVILYIYFYYNVLFFKHLILRKIFVPFFKNILTNYRYEHVSILLWLNTCHLLKTLFMSNPIIIIIF